LDKSKISKNIFLHKFKNTQNQGKVISNLDFFQVQKGYFLILLNMDQQQKEIYLKNAKSNLKLTNEAITAKFEKTNSNIIKIKKSLREYNEDDKIVQNKLLQINKEKLIELESMQESPYFNKCEVDFDDHKNDTVYIGKFSLSEQNIYSWISPIAKIRFEKPGNIQYSRTNQTQKNGLLKQKDQYMITNGKIIYLSTESIGQSRELIYQDYFSNQKKNFILPEIVSQMEKAQDSVIRANYKNSLLISGPAGSGKTTLALHRVAYLLQSPDVADKFNPNKVLVLVQDIGTKEYFSYLLPELGIKNVSINTFSQWVMKVLNLNEYTYQNRIGKDEEEKDYFEYHKLNNLKKLKETSYNKNIFGLLKKIYNNLDKKYLDILEYQQKQKILDRIDLTILLKLFKSTYKNISIMQEYYQLHKKGASTKKIGRFSIIYDLIIFDEFQNYLPQQINLIKSCVNTDNNSIMYVGDMNQKTQLGTIENWQDIGESLKDERKIVLNKVYRNTKQILCYIKHLGYQISVPENIKDGDEVVEKVFDNIEEEIKYVKDNLKEKVTIGILSRDKESLERYQKEFAKEKNIYILAMNEIQGIEFDSVFLVGIAKNNINSSNKIELPNLKQEKQKIDKDLLYVALTRATNNLFVLGKEKLSEIL